MKESVTATAKHSRVKIGDIVMISDEKYTASIAMAIDRNAILGEPLSVLDVTNDTLYVKHYKSQKVFKTVAAICEYFPEINKYTNNYLVVEIWDDARGVIVQGERVETPEKNERYTYKINEYGGMVTFNNYGRNSFPHGYAIIRGR